MINAPVTLTVEEQNFIDNVILKDNFAWYRAPYQTENQLLPEMPQNVANAPFFCHTLMRRVETPVEGQINSSYYGFFLTIFQRWMADNSQHYSTIFRSCLNCVYGVNADFSIPHVDHDWPHHNWIMYLNDSPASTVLFNKDFSIDREIPAVKNTAAAFKEQWHAHRYPKDLSNRIVLVFTYN